MLFAVYKRQKILKKSPSLSNSIFYKDFVVSVFILLIPSLFYQGGSDALLFLFFWISN